MDPSPPTSPSKLSLEDYNAYISQMRQTEYPMLNDPTSTTPTLYLEHAGTPLPSKRLLDSFHANLLTSLYGNPHASNSFFTAAAGHSSAATSSQTIQEAREALLQFVGADPASFDVVFVANATTGIKLVGEALREFPGGFELGMHCESHTSVVGLREWATRSRCLVRDDEVERWLDGDCGAGLMNDGDDDENHGDDEAGDDEGVRLFAYPAQSNLSGRRLPLEWTRRARFPPGRRKQRRRTFILLDAAAYASTARLDLSDLDAAPDFTVLSLYKIFGFPDLGALIVKKDAAHLFRYMKYFGGGTVDMVVCLQETWHAKKSGPLHERLEDGTLPFHNIVAVKSAIRTHKELYGTLDRISQHTADLAKRLYEGLSELRHENGGRVCTIYRDEDSAHGDPRTQGPIVAFNMQDHKGQWISNMEVEKLASIRNIHLRTGGVCNPGGIATALNLAPWELRENFSAGHRCGGENDIANGKPTGVIRVSLGVMSTREDVQRFIEFVEEFFVEKIIPVSSLKRTAREDVDRQQLQIESLTVYPIKSCGGFQIPPGVDWQINPEGLAWDREWCIVHRGTEKALSQKQYPQMALIRTRLDFQAGVLRVGIVGRFDEITIPLSRNPALYTSSSDYLEAQTNVCGDAVQTLTYTSAAIAEFFSKSLSVPCTLARFTKAGSRHCKPHLQGSRNSRNSSAMTKAPRPIHLSNESPVLTITRSSLNDLNAQILASGGKPAHAALFRANIILSDPSDSLKGERPWAEDEWQGMQIAGPEGPTLEFLGGCRRCQMVCVDQDSAEKNAEPFVTLAKTRRFAGRVLFGVHTALMQSARVSSVSVGDAVEAFGGQE